MSGREYKPSDYPLPYVTENLRDWPIYKLTEHKEDFVAEVKLRVKEKIKARFNSEKLLREELAKVLYQERIRLTEKPWKADPKDERTFWNSIKSFKH